MYQALFSKAAAARIAGYGGFAFLLGGIADNFLGVAAGTAGLIMLIDGQYAAQQALIKMGSNDSGVGNQAPEQQHPEPHAAL